MTQTPPKLTKTLKGSFYTYKLGNQVIKEESSQDYEFGVVCFVKETNKWGYLGLSKSERLAYKKAESFKSWSIFSDVQVITIKNS